ncbi:hypothetical protein FisN_12Hh230 [Fistulifera solaris]|uniref:Uncharacterized protein n=1 Tax=Fistulifera solaris TaxID=1519565 RepID=A0A1Z5KBS9_FISSO|nr:hypothetical protein FisN_12Hh230 [Fistulifera solaris]|eukprot:GAX23656.1 hypothetical protein FisN_12Hh230 [Fistulifera solaris]
MDDDDDDDHNEKSKRSKFVSKRRKASSIVPTTIVCSAVTENNPGAVEVGVILCILIIALYLFGFYEAVISLPQIRGDPFHLVQHEESLLSSSSLRGLSQAQNVPQYEKEEEEEEDVVAALQTKKMNKVMIPPGQWPVSIRDEEFETILHPGDLTTQMKVPQLWSYPIHNNELMTRDTALQIGTCIEPDEQGRYNRGESCPLDKRTIFVGIASYRDFECRSTAESIFLRAQHPERIRIAVVDQIVDGEDALCNAPLLPCDTHPEQGLCKYKDQIDVYQMDAALSIGPVFARHIGYRMYRGEYYATQSDAHVTYTQDWDADIIEQFEVTKNEMAVLSTYLTDVQGSIDAQGHSLRHTRPIMCNTYYEGGIQGMHLRHGSQPERTPSIKGSPQLQPWWAAGYSFSRGHFVVNVPYDYNQPMIFQGEEMSIGIRGFTIGYDYYAPERSVCFHHYAVGKNAEVRKKVHHFWENTKYSGTGKKAMARLLGIVHMNPEVDPQTWDHADEDIYGIGGVRTPEKFYETFGINVKAKKVEGHLCSFVDTGGKMHYEFSPFLRSDGMGVDYSKINYKFKDPRPNEK